MEIPEGAMLQMVSYEENYFKWSKTPISGSSKVSMLMLRSSEGFTPIEVSGLTSPIEVGFPITPAMEKELETEDPSCIFFDYSLNDWNTEGCIFDRIEGKLLICKCTHLTDFTVSTGAVAVDTLMSETTDIFEKSNA